MQNVAASVKQELDKLKVQNIQGNNNNKKYSAPVNLSCQFCDHRYESRVELKEHVRRNHPKDQVCQTQTIQTEVCPDIEEKPVEEIFSPSYPCFYSGKLINSASDLVTHKTNHCQTSLEEY